MAERIFLHQKGYMQSTTPIGLWGFAWIPSNRFFLHNKAHSTYICTYLKWHIVRGNEVVERIPSRILFPAFFKKQTEESKKVDPDMEGNKAKEHDEIHTHTTIHIRARRIEGKGRRIFCTYISKEREIKDWVSACDMMDLMLCCCVCSRSDYWRPHGAEGPRKEGNKGLSEMKIRRVDGLICHDGLYWRLRFLLPASQMDKDQRQQTSYRQE
jgi:hypothetical protein